MCGPWVVLSVPLAQLLEPGVCEQNAALSRALHLRPNFPSGTIRPMSATTVALACSSSRIPSVDALRGFVMFTMIYVNDIAGAPDKIVPPWMKHFHGKSGMTFVDLVFPAFLFIVGMSIPFGLGARLNKGETLWRIVLHILTRTLALLGIGIMMVNETPDSKVMGWSAPLWSTLMFLFAILAFCTICPRSGVKDETKLRTWRHLSLALRVVGFVGLAWLAFAFRGENGRRIITVSPISIHTEWYGILGLIGWAYLVSSIVYLMFRGNRVALLGCVVVLICLYPADRNRLPCVHAFDSLCCLWEASLRPHCCSTPCTESTRTTRHRPGAFGLAPSLPCCGSLFIGSLTFSTWIASPNRSPPPDRTCFSRIYFPRCFPPPSACSIWAAGTVTWLNRILPVQLLDRRSARPSSSLLLPCSIAQDSG